MLGEMTAAQFGEWRAFFSLEPFGSVRDDFRFAQLGSAVVNNIPMRGRGAKQLKPADFFGTLRPESRQQSVAEMAAVAAALVAAMGGETIHVG